MDTTQLVGQVTVRTGFLPIHRVYFEGNGPKDAGRVLETERIDGELFVHVAFDDGVTDWFHQQFLASTTDGIVPECDYCGASADASGYHVPEHDPRCPTRDPNF